VEVFLFAARSKGAKDNGFATTSEWTSEWASIKDSKSGVVLPAGQLPIGHEAEALRGNRARPQSSSLR
jgi:hypothetical protein